MVGGTDLGYRHRGATGTRLGDGREGMVGETWTCPSSCSYLPRSLHRDSKINVGEGTCNEVLRSTTRPICSSGTRGSRTVARGVRVRRRLDPRTRGKCQTGRSRMVFTREHICESREGGPSCVPVLSLVERGSPDLSYFYSDRKKVGTDGDQ